MASFGLLVHSVKAHQVISDIRSRLLVDDFVRNPFYSRIVKPEKDFYIINITPIYPKVYLFGFFPFALWVLFPNHWIGTVAIIICYFMIFLSLWWFDRFYFLLFWLATKRQVSYVSAAECLRKVV